ncbi:MAG: hypothetical protein M1837_003173 [Sclerophora amabilis]|nr:MAG: hypothetical protein M1837_003173 [Sclerophora amabilis]
MESFRSLQRQQHLSRRLSGYPGNRPALSGTEPSSRTSAEPNELDIFDDPTSDKSNTPQKRTNPSSGVANITTAVPEQRNAYHELVSPYNQSFLRNEPATDETNTSEEVDYATERFEGINSTVQHQNGAAEFVGGSPHLKELQNLADPWYNRSGVDLSQGGALDLLLSNENAFIGQFEYPVYSNPYSEGNYTDGIFDQIGQIGEYQPMSTMAQISDQSHLNSGQRVSNPLASEEQHQQEVRRLPTGSSQRTVSATSGSNQNAGRSAEQGEFHSHPQASRLMLPRNPLPVSYSVQPADILEPKQTNETASTGRGSLHAHAPQSFHNSRSKRSRLSGDTIRQTVLEVPHDNERPFPSISSLLTGNSYAFENGQQAPRRESEDYGSHGQDHQIALGSNSYSHMPYPHVPYPNYQGSLPNDQYYREDEQSASQNIRKRNQGRVPTYQQSSLQRGVSSVPAAGVKTDRDGYVHYFSTWEDAQEAKGEHLQDMGRDDPTLPMTMEQNQAVVKKLFLSICDVSNTLDYPIEAQRDGRKPPQAYSSFANPKYDRKHIQSICWDVLERARLKQNCGPLVPEWQRTRKASQHQTFGKLIDELCIALRAQKTICKRLMDPSFLDDLVDNPEAQLKRAQQNKRLNSNKAVHIREGRKALGEEEISRGRRKKAKSEPDNDEDDLDEDDHFGANEPNLGYQRNPLAHDSGLHQPSPRTRAAQVAPHQQQAVHSPAPSRLVRSQKRKSEEAHEFSEPIDPSLMEPSSNTGPPPIKRRKSTPRSSSGGPNPVPNMSQPYNFGFTAQGLSALHGPYQPTYPTGTGGEFNAVFQDHFPSTSEAGDQILTFGSTIHDDDLSDHRLQTPAPVPARHDEGRIYRALDDDEEEEKEEEEEEEEEDEDTPPLSGAAGQNKTLKKEPGLSSTRTGSSSSSPSPS